LQNAVHVMRLVTDAAGARRIGDLLFENLDPAGSAVASYEDGNRWIVEAQFMFAPDRERIAALMRAAAGDAAPAIVFSEIAVRDWHVTSLEALRPVRVGRFAVHGRHDREKLAANRLGIEIEAALAFGTGHHGTTQGCLHAIERVAHARLPKRILDIGTGTGVLAIAAARALRRPIVAGDNDPRAVAAARANVRANRASAFVRVVRAEGTNDPAIRAGAPYDLVLANIVLTPLTQLARPVARLLAPGAVVVLSGLLPAQANAALAAWRTRGLVLRRRDLSDGWATLTLVRPGANRKRPGGRFRPGRESRRGARGARGHFTKGSLSASL
jgi:ribosomal protein L11 methyltransferase